jgi:hypothetical protein
MATSRDFDVRVVRGEPDADQLTAVIRALRVAADRAAERGAGPDGRARSTAPLHDRPAAVPTSWRHTAGR